MKPELDEQNKKLREAKDAKERKSPIQGNSPPRAVSPTIGAITVPQRNSPQSAVQAIEHAQYAQLVRSNAETQIPVPISSLTMASPDSSVSVNSPSTTDTEVYRMSDSDLKLENATASIGELDIEQEEPQMEVHNRQNAQDRQNAEDAQEFARQYAEQYVEHYAQEVDIHAAELAAELDEMDREAAADRLHENERQADEEPADEEVPVEDEEPTPVPRRRRSVSPRNRTIRRRSRRDLSRIMNPSLGRWVAIPVEDDEDEPMNDDTLTEDVPVDNTLDEELRNIRDDSEPDTPSS
jgi:hypothetical protein